MSRRPRGTYWAAEWRSVSRLDGDSRHLLHGRDLLPKLFTTRRECRAWIEAKYGYVRRRPDLRAEPHGWRNPRAVLVVVANAKEWAEADPGS